MVEQRRKPGWAFWLTVAVVALPVLYVSSFGPACWLYEHDVLPLEAYHAAYWPLGELMAHGPTPVSEALWWYVIAWSSEGAGVPTRTGLLGRYGI